jgi:hypothetical protein
MESLNIQILAAALTEKQAYGDWDEHGDARPWCELVTRPEDAAGL